MEKAAELQQITSKAVAAIGQEEVNKMLSAAAKAGVEEYERQTQAQKKKEKYNNTFAMLKKCRDAAFYVDNAPAGMDQQKAETALMLHYIQIAADEIGKRRMAAGRGTEYEAFKLYFMDGKDYETIAEQLNTGKNTPRRWVSGIVKDLTVMLYGL